MKKFVFLGMLFAIATAFTFVSCTEKAQPKMLGEYEMFEQNGLFGLKLNGSTILSAEYDEITEQPEYKAIFAKNGDKTTILAAGSTPIVEVLIEAIEPASADYVYVRAGQRGTYLWKTGTTSTIGPFADIVLLDNFVFLKSFDDPGLWGATTLDFHGLAPRSFEKVYVVKNKEDYAVLVYTKKAGWSLHNKDGVTDGVKYDTTSKVLEKQLKKFDTSAPYGVLEVDWKL